MSADNWGACPKCQPVGVFDEMKNDNPRLREDYEQGITQEGEYYCYYSGVCNECGFTYHFKKEEQVWPVVSSI